MSMRRTSAGTRHEGNVHDLELVKAVSQVWHSRSTASSRDAAAASEFDARRLNFQSRSTRFKIEAMQKAKENPLVIVKHRGSDSSNVTWDFSQSLWDEYEILAVSKRLETALVLDGSYAGIDALSRVVRKKRESRNSLRNLLNLMPSRRCNEPESSQDGTRSRSLLSRNSLSIPLMNLL